MNRRNIYLTINIGVLTIWLTVALILIYETDFWPLQLFIIFTALLGSFIFWFNYHSSPYHKLMTIKSLRKNLETTNTEALQPLSLEGMPEEIHSLIDSINYLLNERKDRLNKDYTFNLQASHELRTPLTGIRLQAQIAQRAQSSEQREEALNSIIEATDKSTRLIEQLLILSQIRRYNVKSAKEPIEPSELCKSIISEYHTSLKKKNIILTQNIDKSLPSIQAHREFLDILIRNLLDNALRLTPKHGGICISASPYRDSAVVIRIEDSGPGKAEELFDSFIAHFHNLFESRSFNHSHALSIVKLIAELHCCKILFGHSDLGGLSISLTLPNPIDG